MYPSFHPLPEWSGMEPIRNLFSFALTAMVSVGLAGAHVQPVLEKYLQLLASEQAISPWPSALSWWGSQSGNFSEELKAKR